MAWYRPSSLLDRVFESGIVLKGISGVIEFCTGLGLFFVSPAKIHDWVVLITQRQLVEDPDDHVAQLLLGWTAGLAHSHRGFIIAYLWIHAAIKLITLIGILRNQLWAYPFSLITLGLLVIYQIYQIGLSASGGMIALTIFDCALVWLIWREYGKAKNLLH